MKIFYLTFTNLKQSMLMKLFETFSVFIKMLFSTSL